MRAIIISVIILLIPLVTYGLPNAVRYTIDAELDTQNNVIIGSEAIQITNRTGQTLNELYFHVYPNAFKRGSNSQYQRDLQISGISLGRIYADPNDDAFMEISSITTGGHALSFSMDDTLLKVQLADPFADGAQIELFIKFIYNLMEASPEGRMAAALAIRSGHRNGVYTISLWYPKLVVYDTSGWHLDPYSYLGEFYGDFADYIVELTVPVSFEVGATGRLEFEVDGSIKRMLSFFADDVHDFAWVASARYQVRELEWEGITLRGLYLTQTALADRGLDAIRFYSEQFGRYAYPIFTIAEVEIGGGMEYPALIMIGFGSDREIAHETAHQWWYGAVGNNEFDEGWLDEGFTVFSEERYLIENLGYPEDFARSSLRFHEPGQIVLQPASQYPSLSNYAAAVYTKGSGILWMLRGLLGKETFDGLLREYYKRFQLKNATTKDFTALTEEMSQKELDWFFDEWLRTTKALDFSVEDVRSTPQGDGRYQNTLTVQRIGDAIMPVLIQIMDSKGETQKIEWDGQEAMKQFVVEGDSPLQNVIVDPERTVLEEVRSNNSWFTGQAQREGLPLGLAVALMRFRSSTQTILGWKDSSSRSSIWAYVRMITGSPTSPQRAAAPFKIMSPEPARPGIA
ncbi:MAG: hypothetical protein A2Z21_03905 [Candidatus Fraserbacteria bacterium RBG_16_55_9]|uniref:Peptidase M1 membrane alanine aminopeptidase domain-containing protein n=1 Tax=Fraserbacteria sp. (strain RBG_16_55_9) TaxID=1817864 RepID=A0A1F5UYS0_FRAXR|nr:MAG: hypothetical protein A2Z21_03905 [Candidatus Fraserbacteria bacterium RBG_16_55_9]